MRLQELGFSREEAAARTRHWTKNKQRVEIAGKRYSDDWAAFERPDPPGATVIRLFSDLSIKERPIFDLIRLRRKKPFDNLLLVDFKKIKTAVDKAIDAL
jgi:hypothetical protein